MNECRNFRGTDEKGLSGWSCGFGASGNPTKLQTRLNRKLALILGAMLLKKNGPVIVEDAMENELLFLKAYTDVWTHHSTLVKRRVFYKCSGTSVRVASALGPSRYTTQWTPDSTTIIFPELDATTSKSSEWSKTDEKMKVFLESYYPPSANQKEKEEKPHTIVAVLLLSEVFFRSKECNVYCFGSVHNMLGYLSNQPVVVASCAGNTEFEIATAELTRMDAPAFLQKVCLHNGHRTGYFLNPQYFFNPQMNFLRHIPGKTLDLEKGTVIDVVGVSVIQKQVLAKQLEKAIEAKIEAKPTEIVEELTDDEESEEEEESEESDETEAEEEDTSEESVEVVPERKQKKKVAKKLKRTPTILKILTKQKKC